MEESFEKMVADHMEAGFLENIADMLKHDRSLFRLLGYLIKDERQRVRIGAIALAEALLDDYRDEIVAEVPAIANTLLEDPDPVRRSDAAYMLSVIKDKGALPFLEKALHDPNPAVQESAKEAMEEIRGPAH
jgi:HEAT repeat protein